MQISYEMVSNGSVRELTVSLEAFSERADMQYLQEINLQTNNLS